MPSKGIGKLWPGRYYHLYSRAVGGEQLFINQNNYRYFLRLYDKYLVQCFDTLAFCLLSNHFHFLVRVKDDADSEISSEMVWRWLIAYVAAVNKQRSRRGSLLMKPFKRKEIEDENYFTKVVAYIHWNPVQHEITERFDNYYWSSYHSILSEKPTKLRRAEVLGWFGGRREFVEFHTNAKMPSY